MKNKVSCEVVRDMLPSYIDELTSEETNEMIKEHIAECESCRKVLDDMQTADTALSRDDEIEIAFLKKENKKRKKLLLLIPVMGLLFLGVAIAFTKRNDSRRDFREFALESKRGDTFVFGTYEQDGDSTNGPEEIVWIVLNNKDGELWAISKYALEGMHFHDEETGITWEDSYLRNWLNTAFYENAFSKEEKTMIVTKELINRNNPYYDTDSGNDTKDKVSLLTIKEAESLTLDISICFPTAYGRENTIVGDAKTGHCEWWLRTAGITDMTACTVSANGQINSGGNRVTVPGIAVRPCIYIKYQ